MFTLEYHIWSRKTLAVSVIPAVVCSWRHALHEQFHCTAESRLWASCTCARESFGPLSLACCLWPLSSLTGSRNSALLDFPVSVWSRRLSHPLGQCLSIRALLEWLLLLSKHAMPALLRVELGVLSRTLRTSIPLSPFHLPLLALATCSAYLSSRGFLLH